jgi:hypothetical protein
MFEDEALGFDAAPIAQREINLRRRELHQIGS